MVETRIAKFGNSQAVRIPKPLLKRAGIVDAVTIEERDGGLFIHRKDPPKHPRDGWAEQLDAMTARGEPLDSPETLIPGGNLFDDEEWTW